MTTYVMELMSTTAKKSMVFHNFCLRVKIIFEQLSRLEGLFCNYRAKNDITMKFLRHLRDERL